jgi:hypothetical protein
MTLGPTCPRHAPQSPLLLQVTSAPIGYLSNVGPAR